MALISVKREDRFEGDDLDVIPTFIGLRSGRIVMMQRYHHGVRAEDQEWGWCRELYWQLKVGPWHLFVVSGWYNADPNTYAANPEWRWYWCNPSRARRQAREMAQRARHRMITGE